jgi:hypothetical protein
VPPGVALLNYISSGILWRIFCQTGTFRGVFSKYHYFVMRISEAAMCREHYIFRVPRSSSIREGEIGDGEIEEEGCE